MPHDANFNLDIVSQYNAYSDIPMYSRPAAVIHVDPEKSEVILQCAVGYADGTVRFFAVSPQGA